MAQSFHQKLLTGGLLGLSALAAADASAQDFRLPPLPIRTGFQPEALPGAAVDDIKRLAPPPHAAPRSREQLQAYTLSIRDALKNEQLDVTDAIKYIHENAAAAAFPVPPGVMPNLPERLLLMNINDQLIEVGEAAGKYLDSDDIDTFNCAVKNLTAIVNLYAAAPRFIHPDQSKMFSSSGFLAAVAAPSEDSTFDTLRLSSVATLLNTAPFMTAPETIDALLRYTLATRASHGKEIPADEVLNAATTITRESLWRTQSDTDSTAGLVQLAVLSRKICNEELSEERRASYLLRMPEQFIPAEPAFRSHSSDQSEDLQQQLLTTVVHAYREGLETYRELPDDVQKEKLKAAVFSIGAPTYFLRADYAEQVIETLESEYIAHAGPDPDGIQYFISSMEYQNPLLNAQAQTAQWAPFPLARFLSENSEYFITAVASLDELAREVPDAGDRSAAIAEGTQICEWCLNLPDIDFKKIRYSKAYRDDAGVRLKSAYQWMTEELIPGHCELLKDLIPTTSTGDTPGGVPGRRDTSLLLGQTERLCWLASRAAPDDYRQQVEKIQTDILQSEESDHRAALYRLLQPAVFNEVQTFRGDKPCSVFLREQIHREADGPVQRELAQALAFGTHLTDIDRDIWSSERDLLESLKLEAQPFYAMTGESFSRNAAMYITGNSSAKEFDAGRQRATSIWQHTAHDLLLAAEGDLEAIRSFMPEDVSPEVSIGDVRHRALLQLGYSELEQKDSMFRDIMTTFVEQHLADHGTPHQWGERLALLYQLYRLDPGGHSSSQNDLSTAERAHRIRSELFGSSYGTASSDDHPSPTPALDRYIEGLLLEKGAAPQAVMNANEENLRQLQEKHDISYPAIQLQVAVGFTEALPQPIKRDARAFLATLGYSEADIDNPRGLMELLSK